MEQCHTVRLSNLTYDIQNKSKKICLKVHSYETSFNAINCTTEISVFFPLVLYQVKVDSRISVVSQLFPLLM